MDSDSWVSTLSTVCKAKGEMILGLALVGQIPAFIAKSLTPVVAGILSGLCEPQSLSVNCSAWDGEARFPGLETQMYP